MTSCFKCVGHSSQRPWTLGPLGYLQKLHLHLSQEDTKNETWISTCGSRAGIRNVYLQNTMPRNIKNQRGFYPTLNAWQKWLSKCTKCVSTWMRVYAHSRIQKHIFWNGSTDCKLIHMVLYLVSVTMHCAVSGIRHNALCCTRYQAQCMVLFQVSVTMHCVVSGISHNVWCCITYQSQCMVLYQVSVIMDNVSGISHNAWCCIRYQSQWMVLYQVSVTKHGDVSGISHNAWCCIRYQSQWLVLYQVSVTMIGVVSGISHNAWCCIRYQAEGMLCFVMFMW